MKKGLLFLLMAAFALVAFALVSFGDVDYGAKLDLNSGAEPLYAWETVWSPDGKWIAYRNDGYEIWIVSAEGGTPVKVSVPSDSTMACVLPHVYPPYVKAFYACFQPCFTPDSKEITFSRIITPMAENGTPAGPSTSYIEAVNIATGENRTVREDAYGGTFSSDGKYLAYVKHESNFDGINNEYPEVVLYDIGSDTARTFPEITETLGHLNLSSVRISPDNTWFVFETQLGQSGGYHIYRMPISGGTIREVTTDATSESRIISLYSSISPDGKYILYTQMDWPSGGLLRSAKINLYNTVTGKTTVWLPENTAWGIWMGCFSPDGAKVIYTRINPGASSFEPSEFFIRDFAPPEEDINPTGVEASVPAGFTLIGNYPNPFNPSTHISFTIPASGTAQLSVYDVTGRKVRDLVSSTLSAGTHEMVWDGRDESGAAVSSGTYIARLKAGNFTAAHRMTLMK